MLTHIPIGPVVVPAYPFLVLIGLWAGMWLAAREAERLKIDGDHIYNIGLYGFVAGLLIGRIWYVITHWDAYTGDLTQALSLTANAIDPWAAALAALITGLVYARRHALSLPHLADALAPGAALSLIIGGLGAFLGSQTLGATSDVAWAVPYYGQLRHPTHLYQVGAVLLILLIIWRGRLSPRWPGFVGLLFLTLYAGSRLLVEPFFAAPLTIGAGFSLVQVSALLVMVIILTVMMRLDQQYV